jgi:hypothetical protein
MHALLGEMEENVIIVTVEFLERFLHAQAVMKTVHNKGDRDVEFVVREWAWLPSKSVLCDMNRREGQCQASAVHSRSLSALGPWH